MSLFIFLCSKGQYVQLLHVFCNLFFTKMKNKMEVVSNVLFKERFCSSKYRMLVAFHSPKVYKVVGPNILNGPQV